MQCYTSWEGKYLRGFLQCLTAYLSNGNDNDSDNDNDNHSDNYSDNDNDVYSPSHERLMSMVCIKYL